MNLIDRISECKSPHQLVIAAAGAGKTYTLVNVLAKRLKDKKIGFAENEEIIVFTFTNNAADELLVRLSKILGKDSDILKKIFIGTIHGWCNKYLSEEKNLANTKIVTELERIQLIQRIYPFLKLKDAYGSNKKFQVVEQFLKDIEIFFNENLELDRDAVPKNIRLPIKLYIDFLESQRLIDFGSLIRKSIELIKSSENNKIYHVFVDEYQDINVAQFELINALLKTNKESTLFSVGDPRQTIYQWRGSDVKKLLEFNKDFKESEIFDLSKNRRSREGIVNFANVVSKDMKFESKIDIEDMEIDEKRQDGKISVILDEKTENHEREIAKIIKDLDKKGVRYSDIAILLRSVIGSGKDLMDLFDKEKIPYYSPNRNLGITFIEEFLISIIELMKIISGEEVASNKEEEEEIKERMNDLLSSIRKYCSGISTNKIFKNVVEWYNVLDSSKRKGEYIIYENEQYNFRRQLFNFCESVNFKILENEFEIQEGFGAVTQIMKSIEEIHRRRFTKTWNIRDNPYTVFTRNLKWNLTYQIERWTETGMGFDSKNKVVISTIHAAKGLEWPVVIIPYLWKGKFPVRKSEHGTSYDDKIAKKYGTFIEDEKRLFYVATTRARDNLYIFAGAPKTRTISQFAYSNKVDKIKGIVNSLPKFEKLSSIIKNENERYYSIGVSNFLLLLECPYHFYLRYVVGIDVPVGKELGAGNVLHKIIERLHNKEDKTPVTDIVKEEVYLPLGELKDEIVIGKSIGKKVNNLTKSEILKAIDSSEYPINFNIENLVVSGIIDATRKVDKNVEVIDWKSNIHERFRNRYYNQIMFYAKALRDVGIAANFGTIYDLSSEDLEKGKIVMKISEKDIELFSNNINSIVRKFIHEGPKLNSNKTSCTICDVRQICPNPYKG